MLIIGSKLLKAIQEASDALSRHAAGVKISSDSWYQFSNRVSFAWKLASHGIPTALIYLGFLGDKGISTDHLRDHEHWRETVLNSTRDYSRLRCGNGPSTSMAPRIGD